MGSRGKDPFNFDDIYKQAGVDNLFVKKSMADMKKPAPPPAPIKESPRPQQPPSDNIPAAYTSAAASRQQPVTLSPPKPAASKPSGDPFASINVLKSSNQPMMASRPSQESLNRSGPSSAANSPRPSPASTPAPAAAAPVVSSFDLDDMFGTSAPKASTPAPAVAADPFAVFEAIDGALPADPTPAPRTRLAASADSLVDLGDEAPAAPASAPARPSVTTTPWAQAPAYPTPAPPPAYEAAVQRPPRAASPPKPRRSDPNSRPPPGPNGYVQQYGADAAAPPRYQQDSDDRPPSLSGNIRRTSSDDVLGGRPGSGRSSSDSVGNSTVGAAAGGTLKGLLKTGAVWTKKALRAAKDGLHSMEAYLDKIEETSRPGVGAGGSRPGSATSQQQQHDASDAMYSEDAVIQLAVQVSELPSSKQEEALADLPRGVRLRISELIRRQALASAEAATAAAAPFGAAGAGSRPRPVRQPSGDFIHTLPFDPDDSSDDDRAPAPLAAAAAVAAAATPAAPANGVRVEIVQPPQRRPRPQPPAAAAELAPEVDLLGLSGSAEPPRPPSSAPSPRTAAPVPAAAPVDDLLGFGSSSAAPARPPRAPAPPPVHSPDDVTDFFSGGTASAPASTHPSPRPAAAAPSSPSKAHDDFFSGGATAPAPRAAARPAAASVDLGNMLGGLGAVGGLRGDDDGPVDENEPEIRKQLRRARLAERQARMQAALQEKQDKEQEEERRREEQVHLKEKLGEPVQAWKNKHKGNIRGLLASLQTVLWEDSGWKPLGMGELLEAPQVRKGWMKANLIVHPDKVRQRNGTPDQIAVADMIFDVLKEAMGQFR